MKLTDAQIADLIHRAELWAVNNNLERTYADGSPVVPLPIVYELIDALDFHPAPGEQFGPNAVPGEHL